MVSRNMLSERLGRAVFWLMFVGFNVAFFPMHITGLMGMPRRVWTYPHAMGWDNLNLVSTIGAFVLAAGVLLFVIDLAIRFRPSAVTTGNPWAAGTLEWLPTDVYSTRSIPYVTSREPLWDQPDLARDVEAGAYYLPNAPTGRRETIVTSPIDAEPEYIILMPGPGWAHFFAAVFTAAFFLLLTVKVVTPALVCGLARNRRMLRLGVGTRSRTRERRGRHRRRAQSADLCDRPVVAFLVGDGRADAGRGLALPRVCILLPLPMDGQPPELADRTCNHITPLASSGLGARDTCRLVICSGRPFIAARTTRRRVDHAAGLRR